jgi:hypothetical protein
MLKKRSLVNTAIFLDDAGLSKIKQERNSVIEEIHQLKANNEA